MQLLTATNPGRNETRPRYGRRGAVRYLLHEVEQSGPLRDSCGQRGSLDAHTEHEHRDAVEDKVNHGGSGDGLVNGRRRRGEGRGREGVTQK